MKNMYIQKATKYIMCFFFVLFLFMNVNVVSAEDVGVISKVELAKPQYSIKEDYLKLLNRSGLSVEDITIRHYGVYSGYDIVWMSVKGQMDTTDMAEIRLGRYVFKFNSGSASRRLYAYKDGEFIMLKNAYDDGLITDEDVEKIAERYGNTYTIRAAFKDVIENDWFYSYVDDVFVKGWMTGLNSSYFGSNEFLTRAQFAKILYNMENSPEVISNPGFDDVLVNEWYTDSISWAYEKNIVSGYDNKSFGPNDKITREQIAVMIYRYAKYKGCDMSENANLGLFPDSSDVSAYAYDAVSWCVANGIISGDNGKLKPYDNTSRAVGATIISRYADTK